MSVEPGELMSEAWTRWQGHVIHNEFPLGRFLGGSDRSGVFLTRSAAPGAPDVVIKLIPADRALAESQLPRWKRALVTVHPHLLGLLQSGGCQLDGLPYIYVVMEYADQTLSQVLQSRALTDDEAREMLRPTLDALAFLHGQNLLQGQLKPENILVVGDQLKLASDTIRRLTEAPTNARGFTVYDPPEARYSSSSPAGDIWALGVCLFEALTRRPPTGLREPGAALVLPNDFPPAFREIVTRCLSPDPLNRPSATELMAWIYGQPVGSAPDATPQPTSEPTPTRTTPHPAALEAAQSGPSVAKHSNSRVWITAMLGGVAILALGWAGVRMVRSHGTPATLPAPNGSPSLTPGAGEAMVADARKYDSSSLPPKASRSDLATPPLALHEVIPDISASARRTIIGHIKVWIRVIVDRDGTVYAATADRMGPSRYFQRLAIEAAKQWTFPPIETQSRRLLQIRFDFSRGGATGRVVALR
jgi:serine/threonine protein kinase